MRLSFKFIVIKFPNSLPRGEVALTPSELESAAVQVDYEYEYPIHLSSSSAKVTVGLQRI